MQGELERVLSHLADQEVELTCAGRTDAGVHARGQVAHVDIDADRVHEALTPGRINRALSSDVRIHAVSEVSLDFDARFSALWRRYSYTVCDDPRGPSPFARDYQLDLGKELNIESMNAAALPLVGEHDFTSYCKLKEFGSTIREIQELRWSREIEASSGLSLAVMHVKADAFCHSMVRSLAGALIPVGEGRRDVDYPKEALEKRSRDAGVTVMPAHPLVLEEVGYPAESEWAARQDRTRTVRTLD